MHPSSRHLSIHEGISVPFPILSIRLPCIAHREKLLATPWLRPSTMGVVMLFLVLVLANDLSILPDLLVTTLFHV